MSIVPLGGVGTKETDLPFPSFDSGTMQRRESLMLRNVQGFHSLGALENPVPSVGATLVGLVAIEACTKEVRSDARFFNIPEQPIFL